MFESKPSLYKQDKNLARAGAFDDLRKIARIRTRHTLVALCVFVAGFLMIFPVHVMVFGGVPFPEKMSLVQGYFADMFRLLSPRDPMTSLAWFRAYTGWYFIQVYQGYLHFIGIGLAAQPGIPIMRSALILGPWIIGFVVPVMMIKPMIEGLEETPNIFGDTRWADERDVMAMSSKDLVGFDGKLFLVGKLKDKLIRMKETLSVLLLAPPGTGKTVAFIVPSTVMMDSCCQLLNDQKPELFHMTSGHRSTLGPVFQIMWSAQDMPNGGWMTEEQAALINPDLIERDEKGQFIRDLSGAIRVKPIHYPSWNPIGPASIPSAGVRRDLYIERLASVLAPDPTGGGDKFWTSRARGAMIGLIHYLVAKVEMGQSEQFPELDEEGIPALWRGKEASFPMLVDWFTAAQNAVEDAEGDDPMRTLFKNAIAEARTMDDLYVKRMGTPILNRTITELTSLMNSPDKTRGSILTTLDEAMSPFKNEAVRQRTFTSSFSFNELRGRAKPAARAREFEKKANAAKDGLEYHPRYARDEWDPITIYISINAEDAKAFATITGIFVDSANAYLVANGPNAIDDRGNELGPHAFFFLLDETPTLPKLDTVINGPAVGRSKNVSYAIVGQDFAQIETRYSRPEVETMKSTTAIKVVLSQNNETAAKAISVMAGSMTYKKASYGRKDYGDPVTKFLNMTKEIVTGENWEKREFIDPSFVMSMPSGKHIVLVQSFMNRPILADTPRFFLEPEIAKRVYNLRTGTGPKPALPMPVSMMKAASVAAEETKRRKITMMEINRSLENPVIALVVSPSNISDVTRDLSKAETVNRDPVGTRFAVAHVRFEEGTQFFPLPTDDQIVVSDDPAEIAGLVKDRPVVVFGQDDRDALLALLSGAGQEAIPKELFDVVKPQLLEIQDEAEGDFFTIGFYGYTNCTVPRDPAALTPKFAVRWFAEMVTFIRGFNSEMDVMKASK